MTDCQQQWNLGKNPTAVTGFAPCPVQRITRPPHPLTLQLTHFAMFTSSPVGKTWLRHFIALRLKNKLSHTGENLFWLSTESDQGCGWRPRSHCSFLTPLSKWSISPYAYLLPGHQTCLCSSICGSGQGTTQGCSRSSLPLLYPNGTQGKDKERRVFSPKHEDGWQWGSTTVTAFAAPLWLLISLSQLLFAMCGAGHCLLRKLNATLSYCITQGACKLNSSPPICSVLIGFALPWLNKSVIAGSPRTSALSRSFMWQMSHEELEGQNRDTAPMENTCPLFTARIDLGHPLSSSLL